MVKLYPKITCQKYLKIYDQTLIKLNHINHTASFTFGNLR